MSDNDLSFEMTDDDKSKQHHLVDIVGCMGSMCCRRIEDAISIFFALTMVRVLL